MKYMFHDAFVSASAPKAAQEIIALVTKAVGSEMDPHYFPMFFSRLKEMAAEVTEKGKVTLSVEMTELKKEYGKGVVSRAIYVQRKRNYGHDDVARLFCTSVNAAWEERTIGHLEKYDFGKKGGQHE